MQHDPPPVNLDFLADRLKALADPKRLLIFHMLMEGMQCNCELGESLGMAPNLVSHHLRLLREAGLVEAERDAHDARWVYYSVNSLALEAMRSAFGVFFAAARIKPRRPTCGPASTHSQVDDHLFAANFSMPASITSTGDRPMAKIRVLFICVHNSARSQMAEAWLNTLFGDQFLAESAGFEPGVLNPLAVHVLQEEGIDIAHKQTRDVFAVYKSGKLYDYVITVCDETAAERCPIFPGVTQRIHWSFRDPSRVQGTEEEKLAQVRVIRDQIRQRIEEWAPVVAEGVH